VFKCNGLIKYANHGSMIALDATDLSVKCTLLI
jgi:hypothetical protein